MCASLPSFFLHPPPYTGLAAGDQTERARLNKFALIFVPTTTRQALFPPTDCRRPTPPPLPNNNIPAPVAGDTGYIPQKNLFIHVEQKNVSASSTKNRGKRSSSKEPSLCSKKGGKGMTQALED